MSKQVDLSDPNLDLSQLCLRGYKHVNILSVKRDYNISEDSILAYVVTLIIYKIDETALSNVEIIFKYNKNGLIWSQTKDKTDIIYKSDFEA